MTALYGGAAGTKLREYHRYIGQNIRNVAYDMGTSTTHARGRLAAAALRVDRQGIVYETKAARDVQAELDARRSNLPAAPCFSCGCRICSCRGALAA